MNAETVSEDQVAWEMSWWFLAAYAAGRASVIESEDFKVVRDAARICAAHNDIEAFEVRVVAPFRSADQSAKAAAIRTALEALR